MTSFCRMLCVLFTVTSVAYACEMRVGYEPWEPYIVEQNGEFSGPEYDTLMTLSHAAGCQLTFLNIPWARALILLENNEIDMLYGASQTPERRRFARFSKPYRTDHLVLMQRQPSPLPAISFEQWVEDHLSHQANHKIGLIPGFYYGNQIGAFIEQITQQSLHTFTRTDDQQQKMLESGRIEGYLINELAAKAQQYASATALHFVRLNEDQPEPMHLMFARSVSVDIVKRFDDAIAELPE